MKSLSSNTDWRVARTPVALTVAGFDPSGGAGIIADIRTFAALGCFPTAVITSLTFQNTTGLFGALHQSVETVRAQVVPILADFGIAGVKTGMLPTSELVVEVARWLKEMDLPAPVVDPVMRSTSGQQLLDDGAISSLVSELLPLARVVTPNIAEAERLTGKKIDDEDGMRRAASLIRKMGARAVLVKGGHLGRRESSGGWLEDRLPEVGGRPQEVRSNKRDLETDAENSMLPPEALDVLDDAGTVTVFREERVARGEFHGSGCTLSAAIAAGLAKGLALEAAVREAKHYVTQAMRHAPDLGHGPSPLR